MRTRYFNGIRFVRRKDGYYEAKIGDKRVLMHRYVWSYYNGEIPNGYVIHHKDENRGNNAIDNLECLSNYAHSKYHGLHKPPERAKKDIETLHHVRHKATVWHKSEDGREWHRCHMKDLRQRGVFKSKRKCVYCGNEYIGESHGGNTFCSDVCKSAWRRKSGLDDEERECVMCGNKFMTNKYGKTKTCSRSCGMRLAHLNNPSNWRSEKYANRKGN